MLVLSMRSMKELLQLLGDYYFQIAYRPRLHFVLLIATNLDPKLQYLQPRL